MFIKVLFSFCFCYSTFVLAASVTDGFVAYADKKYQKAFDIWKLLADGGDAKSSFYLSQLYKKGEGVGKDDELAIKYLVQSASSENAQAQFNLGDRYMQGNGFKASPVLAAFWWKRAAEQGMVRAQHNMGTLYLFGKGVGKSAAQARVWFERAAENGSERSKKTLGIIDKAYSDEIATEEIKAPIAKTPIAKTPIAKTPIAKAPVIKATVEAPVTKKIKKLVVKSKNLNDGQQWMRNQPSNGYTIQLLAGDSHATMRRITAKYQLEHPLVIYQFKGRKQNLYGISYGSFKGISKAEHAAKSLPEQLRKDKPWIREFSVIQSRLVNEKPE